MHRYRSDPHAIRVSPAFGEEQGSVKLPIRLVTRPASPALRVSGQRRRRTRIARIAGASGRRFPTSQTPAAERLQASAEAARVLSSDRRNRSKPAARGGPIPASHTAASRLIQQSTDASEAAALVLAIQEFVANGGGRPWSAPPHCCIAGADGQPWPCRSAWLVAFRTRSLTRPRAPS